MTTLAEAFKEYMLIGALSENEQAEYYLIRRYEAKASPRLLERRGALMAKAEIEFGDFMQKRWILHRSVWFGHIKLGGDRDWVGGHMTLPFKIP